MHRYTRGKYEHDDILADTDSPEYGEDSDCATAQCETTRAPLDLPLHKPSCIDHEYTDHERNPKVMQWVYLDLLAKPLTRSDRSLME